jgi:hypothetical protein
MSDAKMTLILAPTSAEQARANELMAALATMGGRAQQMVVEGNYEQVLDALAGGVSPVVVK